MEGIFFMKEKFETYDLSFKKQAVDLYLQRRNYPAVAKELNIHRKLLQSLGETL